MCSKYGVAVASGLTAGAASMIWVSAAPASQVLSTYFGVDQSLFVVVTAAYYAAVILGLIMALVFL